MNKSIESHEPPSAPTRLVNGLTGAPTRWQLTSISIFTGIFAQHYATIAQVSGLMLRIVFISIETILVLLLLFVWYKVSSINPSDPVHQQQLNSIARMHVNEQQLSTIAQGPHSQSQYLPHRRANDYSCPVCRTHRLSISTHCKKCNKCIMVLDHHCKWINNCIGAANYYQFIVLLIHIVILLLYNASVNIWCIVRQMGQVGAIRIITIVSTVISLILCLILLVLIGFHIVLIKLGKTNLKLIRYARNSLKHRSNDTTPTPTCSTPKQAQPSMETTMNHTNTNTNTNTNQKDKFVQWGHTTAETVKNSNKHGIGDRRGLMELKNIKLDKIVLKNRILAKIGMTN